MTLDLYGTFLEQITHECFPCGVQERNLREKAFFKLRFHPNNNGENYQQHTQIAKLMEKIPGLEGDCVTAIGTTCQNVVHTIAEKYDLEMRQDGVDVDSLFNREKGQKGAWKEVYPWLQSYKFPRWRTDFIWQIWQQQAQSNRDWIHFGEYDCQTRKLVVPTPPPPSNQIQMNKSLKMQIELEYLDRYLLLLNRGKDEQDTETKYLICPSQAFAPQLEIIGNLRYLPQSEAMCTEIKFDAAGKEEYIGIVVNKIPDHISWLNPNPQEPTPIWDGVRIYELWQELEKQADCQFFYQSFEIVSNSIKNEN